jgi:hypothetical protein
VGTARGLRGGGGRRRRRCGQLLESLGGTIPWSELEHLGVRAPWWPAYPPHPNPPLEEEGPAIPTLSRRGPGEAALELRVAACYEQLRALPRRLRRALQRHFVLSLAELALLLALWLGPGWAAMINVDGTTCTLAAAITAANTDAIAGGCPAGSGADTLVLPTGSTLTLTNVDNTTYGPTGLPVVSSTITIAGQGSTLERGGSAPAFRLVAVGVGGELAVQNLTLRGGIGDRYGGGVYNTGSLTLTNSTVSGDSAVCGGGIFSTGSLTLTNSTVSGNTAYCGGGVFNTGSLTLTNSTVSGNSASYGGGVSNTGSLTLANSTLSGNAADSGGGVFNEGTLTLANGTLSDNTASSLGGGVFNQGILTLTNSTLSGNAAVNRGGGVYNSYGTLTLTNSTLSGNAAGTDGGGVFNLTGPLTLARTLVSGNTAAAGAESFNQGGTVTADNINLFGHDGTAGVSGFTPGGSDVVPGEPLSAILDPILFFNGGPTQTNLPVGGSPAVDAVPAEGCQLTDQRGFVRPTGAACDIGAVELGANPPPVVNSLVSFVALPATFSTTTDTTGCPLGFAGKFFFQAQLTNLAGSPSFVALKDAVVHLSNGNLVQTADGAPAGVGSLQTLPQVGDFSDGVLEATGTLQVPFAICLKNLNPFRFTVNVLGRE